MSGFDGVRVCVFLSEQQQDKRIIVPCPLALSQPAAQNWFFFFGKFWLVLVWRCGYKNHLCLCDDRDTKI